MARDQDTHQEGTEAEVAAEAESADEVSTSNPVPASNRPDARAEETTPRRPASDQNAAESDAKTATPVRDRPTAPAEAKRRSAARKRAKVIATSDSAPQQAAGGNGPPQEAPAPKAGNGPVAQVRPPRRLPSRKAAPSDQPWAETELRSTLKASKQELAGLRRRLKVSYLLLIVMSLGLFVFGMAMVGFPALAYYRGEIDEPTFALLGGFGALVLALLLYFRPLERIQALIADATYVSMVKDSFHYQVTLRLMAVDTDDSRAVARAAGYVAEAAQSSMDLVYTQMQARRAAGLGRPVAG